MLVDAKARGSLMEKSIEAIMELIEERVANTYQWPFERYTPRKTLRVYELDMLTILSSQVATLSSQVSSLTTQANVIKTLTEIYNLCGGLHLTT